MPVHYVGSRPFTRRAQESERKFPIWGFHDPGGEYILEEEGTVGWVLFTVRSDQNQFGISGMDRIVRAGHKIIARANWNYFPYGTIPPYADTGLFIQQTANMVGNTPQCHRWIIGNEMNHFKERPLEVKIAPSWYAEVFKKARDEIVGLPGHKDDEVIPGAIAPWYPPEPLEYLDYFVQTLELCQPNAIALHTYSRGSDPASITSTSKMGDPPYKKYYDGFQAYTDFMRAIPGSMRGLPVYITETNQYGAWDTRNTGWVREAISDIELWNAVNAQKIEALLLYRWQLADMWSIVNRPGVQEDLRMAIRERKGR